MTKNSKRGLCFIAAGTMLLLAALSLVLWNTREDRKAGKTAQQTLEELKETIPEQKKIPTEDEPYFTDETIVSEPAPEDDEAIELDGEWYIGVISIPQIDLELPVLRDWSYPNLNIAPCRYSGSTARGDMIIAAHNYSSFFKRLGELNSGDEIYFTNLSGYTRVYEVDEIDYVGGYDVDSMLEGSENWDLTLFTCTWSGYSRVTVRAVEK